MTLLNHNLDDLVARCRTNEEVLRRATGFVEGQSAAEIMPRSAVLCGTCAAELASD